MKLKTTIITLAAMLFVSCSDDDEWKDFNGNIDSKVLTEITEGRVDAFYQVQQYKTYRKDSSTGNQWQEFNLSDYAGLSLDLLSFNVRDGYSWEPVCMFSNVFGPSRLDTPWFVYCRLTGYGKQVYVKRTIEFDSSDNSLLINDLKCSVAKADGNGLNLSYTIPYSYRDANSGKMESGEYLVKLMLVRQPSTGLPEVADMETFNTHINAKLGMIDLMRQEFGNIFDPADYQNRIAENIGSEIIDFDDLAEKIRVGQTF